MLRNSLSTPLNTRTKNRYTYLGVVSDNNINAIWVPVMQNVDYTNNARWVICSGTITLGIMYSSNDHNTIDFIEYGFSHTHTCGRTTRITSKNAFNSKIPYVSCQVTPLLYNNLTNEMGFFILDDYYYLNNITNVPVSIEVTFTFNNLSNHIINNITPKTLYSDDLLNWYKHILNGSTINGSGIEHWVGEDYIARASGYAPSNINCLYMNHLSEKLQITLPKLGYRYIQMSTIANGVSVTDRKLIDLETNIFWGSLTDLITRIKTNQLSMTNINVLSTNEIRFFKELNMSFVSEDDRTITFELNPTGDPASIPDNLIKIVGIPNTVEYRETQFNLTPVFQQLTEKKNVTLIIFNYGLVM